MEGSRTQRITAKDITGGRIRVPHETKKLFPMERARIAVDLLGHRLDCRWDPKYGPDQERSGVIGIGRQQLSELVVPDEVLFVFPSRVGVEIQRNPLRKVPSRKRSEERLGALGKSAAEFAKDRDWEQFHNPKDLALSLVLEATELAELMQWKNGEELNAHLAVNSDQLGDELADVLWYTLLLAGRQKIDLADAFARKLAKNAAKYPIETAKGSAAKYTELVKE